MSRMKTLLIGAMVMVSALAVTSSRATVCTATNTGPATAAGSKKDTCGDIHCGTVGTLPTGNPGGVRLYFNLTSEGPQLEACNDGGPGNTQGRLVIQTSNNTAHPGIRITLDTDDEQPFPPGYINVQLSSVNPGVWCNNEGKDGEPGTAEPTNTADGWRHQWTSPGTQGGANAVPWCMPVVG